MGLMDNLGYAMQALAYVQERISIGASNKLSDIVESKGESLGCVFGSRVGQFLQEQGIVKPDWAAGKLHIEVLALGAEKAGCGNCGEQSAVAWVYLWKSLEVRPLDWMQITNGDHAFVVIGRTKDSKASDAKTWGEEAVVCDPWDKKAYAASEIYAQMAHIKGDPEFGSMLRVS